VVYVTWSSPDGVASVTIGRGYRRTHLVWAAGSTYLYAPVAGLGHVVLSGQGHFGYHQSWLSADSAGPGDVDGQQQVAQVGLVSEGERRDLGQPVVAQVEPRQLSQSGERSVDRRQSIMRQVDV